MKVQIVTKLMILAISALMTSPTHATDKQTHKINPGLYLSDIKISEQTQNIQVIKLASDKNTSDFIVFVKKQVPPHKHMTHSETVLILEGTGVFTLNGKEISVGPGHYIKIPQGAVHSVVVTSTEALKALSVQAPEFFGKDRILVNEP